MKSISTSSHNVLTRHTHINHTHTHTHAQPFYGPLGFCPGLPWWAGTNLDLLEEEIVSGSGISWAICKSAPWPRYITMPASHHSVFYKPDALPAAQPTASKHYKQLHWRQCTYATLWKWNSMTQLKCYNAPVQISQNQTYSHQTHQTSIEWIMPFNLSFSNVCMRMRPRSWHWRASTASAACVAWLGAVAD